MAHDMYVKCLTFETFTFQLFILGFFKVPLSEVHLSQFFTSFMKVSYFNCLIIHVENLIVLFKLFYYSAGSYYMRYCFDAGVLVQHRGSYLILVCS